MTIHLCILSFIQGKSHDDEIDDFFKGPVPSEKKKVNLKKKPTLVLHNNFDPFRRLPNLLFTFTGRPRSVSVDSRDNSSGGFIPVRRRRSSTFIPKLEPIEEELGGFGDDIENLFK